MRKFLSLIAVIVLACLPATVLGEVDEAAMEMLDTMQKLVREADNITISGTFDMEYSYKGEATSVGYTDVTVYFHDPLVIHNIGTNKRGETAEYFVVQQGDEFHKYASHINESYMTDIEEITADELVAETMGEYDAITHIFDAVATSVIVGEEIVSVNGADTACTRIAATIHADRLLEELVHNTLLSTPNSDHTKTDAIEAALSDLTVPVEVWINTETGFLVQYSFDYIDIIAGIYTQIDDAIDDGFTFTIYQGVYQVTGVNDAQEIMIPAKYIAFNEH